MKQKFNIITSTCVPLPLENVDTDQIIPARFLKATTREESFFGENLFRDWRYNADGTVNKDFVLNNPTYGGGILVAGKNFGSGSSREHAAWTMERKWLSRTSTIMMMCRLKRDMFRSRMIPRNGTHTMTDLTLLPWHSGAADP